MPRVLRYLLVLAALAVTSAAALAQPSGGGTAQATPVPDGPATRPPVITDFQDVLDDPETAMGELIQIFQTYIDDFIRENRVRIERNFDVLPSVVSMTNTRLLAIVLGILALITPRASKVLVWLYLGAVVGWVVLQLPIGDELRVLLARNDLSFMVEEPVGSIALVGGFALGGLIVLSPLFFLAASAAGALAGVTIALQIMQNTSDAAAAAVAIGGFIGFIVTAWALGRGSLLIPLAIGAGLVVFGFGAGPGWMVPLMLFGGLVATVRSPKMKERLKRTMLPELTLKEGKVDIDSGKPKRRDHLHEIIPAMADDRDNPLIKR